jgi:hypothetical protein
MLWRSSHQVIAHAIALYQPGNRLARVLEQRPLEMRINPGLGDDAGADVGADLRLIGRDDAIERRGFDVALLRQNALERAHAKLDVGELRTAFCVCVIIAGHRRTLADPGNIGQC